MDALADAAGSPADESRRRFVRSMGVGSAVALGAVAVPAAVLASPAAAQDTTTTVLAAGDVTTIEWAEGIELALSQAYLSAIDTKLFTSSQAETCRLFSRHHEEHAAALEKQLTDAGVRSAGDPALPANAALLSSLQRQITAAGNATAILTALQAAEESSAATYQTALGSIEKDTLAGVAAGIMPIEGQHSVVLGQMLDEPVDQWMPSYQPTTGAFDPAEYPA